MVTLADQADHVIEGVVRVAGFNKDAAGDAAVLYTIQMHDNTVPDLVEYKVLQKKVAALQVDFRDASEFYAARSLRPQGNGGIGCAGVDKIDEHVGVGAVGEYNFIAGDRGFDDSINSFNGSGYLMT